VSVVSKPPPRASCDDGHRVSSQRRDDFGDSAVRDFWASVEDPPSPAKADLRCREDLRSQQPRGREDLGVVSHAVAPHAVAAPWEPNLPPPPPCSRPSSMSSPASKPWGGKTAPPMSAFSTSLYGPQDGTSSCFGSSCDGSFLQPSPKSAFQTDEDLRYQSDFPAPNGAHGYAVNSASRDGRCPDAYGDDGGLVREMQRRCDEVRAALAPADWGTPGGNSGGPLGMTDIQLDLGLGAASDDGWGDLTWDRRQPPPPPPPKLSPSGGSSRRSSQWASPVLADSHGRGGRGVRIDEAPWS